MKKRQGSKEIKIFKGEIKKEEIDTKLLKKNDKLWRTIFKWRKNVCFVSLFSLFVLVSSHPCNVLFVVFMDERSSIIAVYIFLALHL